MHYHKQTTEVYHILDGTGTITLNEDQHDIEPGDTIWIEPGTRHAVRSAQGLRTIVVAIPAFDPADEWFD
jgi:mannose-6-phosphate isomerase-like protein (cupin superfamily)